MGKLTALLGRLAAEFPVRMITRLAEPYLARYQVINTKWFGIKLHHFTRSDADQELHNHPWKWAASLILVGGYSEERLLDGNVYRRTLKPGRLNLIFADTFHRVDLLDKECWSLFITGPRIADWGFMDRRDRKFIPWREFTAYRKVKNAQ